MLPNHEELLREFREFAMSCSSAKALMQRISDRLHESMTRYNWVGFYLVDAAAENVLIVGPYAGSFTPNTRIPLNTGLCGAAATTGETVVVDDVAKDPRYLPGSPLVKAEIVVPIFVKKKLAAELDIESYFTAAFTPAEREFAEACSNVVANYLAGPQH